MAKKPRKKFDTGEGNLDMIKNSVTAIKHHADELTSELKKNPKIEAWVLAKVDRAAQNLSDVTHYLDGEMNKFANGGEIELPISKIVDEEIRVYSNNIKNILGFVGEGVYEIDVESFAPRMSFNYQNEISIYFNEDSWGGISKEDWNKAAKILDKYVGENGFESYDINPSHNYLKLYFSYNNYPMGDYEDFEIDNDGGYMAKGGAISDLQKEISKHKELSLEIYPNGKMALINGLYGVLVDDKLKNTIYVGNEYYEMDGVIYKKNEKGDRPTKLKMADGGKLSKKSFIKKYEENEDQNMHSENVVLLAETYGTESDIRDAKTILAKHESMGHLPSNLREERNDLHDKLWSRHIQSREKDGYVGHYGELKEYLFNFNNGGWNSIIAPNKKQAIKLAKAKYEDAAGRLKVDESTFRIKTEKDYKKLWSETKDSFKNIRNSK
jgi:hypothetical protein